MSALPCSTSPTPASPSPERAALAPAWFPSPADPSLAGWWPPFGLQLHAPGLTLRPVQDEDLPHLLTALQSGVHPAGQNPFGPVAWTQAPPQDVARQTLQHLWRCRAQTGPQDWTLNFGVWDTTSADAVLLGLQDLSASDYSLTRTVQSGSWLRHDAQGRGIGRRARAMILTLAFDHLGALAAETSCAEWNQASRRVSLSLGYEPNGVHVRKWGRTAEAELDFRLTPERFRRLPDDVPLQITGLQPVLDFLRIPTECASPDGPAATSPEETPDD